ncbi:hypothetical protein quinque_005069 [Culex quinquefasciatus]
MFEHIVILFIQVLPLTVDGLCQLGDCSSSTKILPNCPKSEFTKKEVYRPIGYTKPTANPNHLFNLIHDRSERNCTRVVLSPGVHDSVGFSYYLDVTCRADRRPYGVYLALEAFLHRGVVACYHRSNISMWMAKNCKIFGRERISSTERKYQVHRQTSRLANALYYTQFSLRHGNPRNVTFDVNSVRPAG